MRFRLLDQDFTIGLDDYDVQRAAPTSTPAGERATPRSLRSGFTAGAPEVMEVPSPDGRWLAADEDGNLALRSVADDQHRTLTDDGSEFDAWTVQGLTWAPDGLGLVASRSDTSACDRLPVVHWLQDQEQVEFHPYTKSGGPTPRTSWWWIDIRSRERVLLEGSNLADHGCSPLGFFADGEEFWFLRMNRTMSRIDVLAADVRTGQSRLVHSEVSETFIEGLRLGAVLPSMFTPLGDAEFFVWMSERSGWCHFYLFDREGRLVRPLTHGDWAVLGVERVDYEGVDAAGQLQGWLYFHGNAEAAPYQSHLYRVPLSGGEPERLTEGVGRHAVQFSPTGEYFVDAHSSVTRAPTTELRRADGTLVRTVSTADLSALEEMGWKPPQEFTALAADGVTELHGVLYTPWDHDGTTKLPLVDSIYNGPFTLWAPKTFTAGIGVQAQALAQRGFAVFVVDGRGTPERGKAFQDVVYRRFGQHEIEDHAAVVQQLCERHEWLDGERVGIFGGSWGGYMTIRALVTRPDVYRVGVATNPVCDLYDHAAAAIEPYMGLPRDNPEGYAAGSSLALVNQLTGHLLVAHGTSDVNATFSSTMKLVHALVQANKPFDLLVYPEADHWMRGPIENAGNYQEQRRVQHFVEHLEPDREVPVSAANSP